MTKLEESKKELSWEKRAKPRLMIWLRSENFTTFDRPSTASLYHHQNGANKRDWYNTIKTPLRKTWTKKEQSCSNLLWVYSGFITFDTESLTTVWIQSWTFNMSPSGLYHCWRNFFRIRNTKFKNPLANASKTLEWSFSFYLSYTR